MIIGLIKERKKPEDNRVALSPLQCAALRKRYPTVEIRVESCSTRCFPDAAYAGQGIAVVNDMSACDVLLGIKEVPKEALIPGKTYFFFSHTIKKQPHNRELLQEIIKKNIRLIDYETLKWENGQRVLGFGRWAGIVGAYNGLLTWGKKTGKFELKPAHLCEDYTELLQGASQVDLGNIRIVLTGGGRVGMGALEFLRNIRMQEVSENDYFSNSFSKTVFVHLNSPELYKHRENRPWDSAYFYAHHSEYVSAFKKFIPQTDLLINGIFWTPDLPRLFEKEDTGKTDFRIKVIADISCDEDGSVPLTYKTASIEDPVLGWDRVQQTPCAPYTENSIDVMAVGNLPNELPRDASEAFGEKMLHYILPEYMTENSRIIRDATIAENGDLTELYKYLEDYISTTD